ncbi:MAG: iron-containing alcohol dehydrogenase [Bacteroidota bacterium]
MIEKTIPTGLEEIHNSPLASLTHSRLKTNVVIAYDVIKVKRIFNPSNSILANAIGKKKCFCIIDEKVMSFFGEQITSYFEANNITFYTYQVSVSEQAKNIDTIIQLLNFCYDNQISRRDYILCIGGGIVCDLGGFAANLLRRSTPCIKIPTTLIGVVDAAIGVKTAVNFKEKKNSIGTYYSPDIVFYDTALLTTLPENEIKYGLVEMIKIIAIKDAGLWEKLKAVIHTFYPFPQQQNDRIDELIDYAIKYMLEELQPNIFEKKLQRIVDYGHEFAHPIEVVTDYELTHGEAVATGMLISNAIAYKQGIMYQKDYEDFKNVIIALALPLWHNKITLDFLKSVPEKIKLHKDGRIDLVVLERVGTPHFLNDVHNESIEFAYKELLEAHQLSNANK